jgi:hypothetical protein
MGDNEIWHVRRNPYRHGSPADYMPQQAVGLHTDQGIKKWQYAILFFFQGETNVSMNATEVSGTS